MIPKKIHYCWFGRNELPASAKKCIASWKMFFPEYDIVEWNESNYDVKKIPYLAMAYEAKKYAFVSDYARIDILYHEGGINFDTDVEVIQSFDDVITDDGFMGCEIDGAELQGGDQKVSFICVNPGLGIAAPSELMIYKEIMEFYETFTADDKDKVTTKGFIVPQTTKILMQRGMKDITGIQKVEGISIYPKEYFNPLN